jgi:TonB family protein
MPATPHAKAMLCAAGLLLGQPAPSQEVTYGNYPERARRNEEEGTSRLELTIAVSGLVTGCRLLKSSGSEELDRAACEHWQTRTRFKPATLDGKPVESTRRFPTVWRLGIIERDTPAFKQTQNYRGHSVDVTFAPDGALTSCTITPMPSSAAVAGMAAEDCQRFGDQAIFERLLAVPTKGLASASLRFYEYDKHIGGAFPPIDFPVQRRLMSLSMDRLPDGRITWCEVKDAPADPVLGYEVDTMCRQGRFAATGDRGGFPFYYQIDVVATVAH